MGEDGWDKGHKTRDRGHGPTHGDGGEGKRRGTQDTEDAGHGGHTGNVCTHAYRNKEDAKQRLQRRCSIVRTVKKRDRKAQGHCKRKKWTNVQKLNFATNRKPSNLSLS